MTGQSDLAIEDYGKAVKLNPQPVDAYVNQALAYEIKKKYKLALSDILKAREFGYEIDNKYIEDLKKTD